jgi:hypothetical protein
MTLPTRAEAFGILATPAGLGLRRNPGTCTHRHGRTGLRQAQEICVWEKASVQIGVVDGQQIIPAGAVPDPLEGDRVSAAWNP